MKQNTLPSSLSLLLALLMLLPLLVGCNGPASSVDPGDTETSLTELPPVSDSGLVTPDQTKVPHIEVTGKGSDIYTMTKGIDFGYRYGCSYLYEEDGSTIHAYFASPTGIGGVWDWILYSRSDNGGKSWDPAVVVLAPTENSLDARSCCDPGVVYFGGYYYLGYTSTMNEKGYCNNLFVARAKRPGGPFEKWNGNGWGGSDPKPIVTFDETYQDWGIGEASFVELNGKLYIYYTNTTSHGDYMMVATADATNENWPLTMQNHGVACRKETDSVDVKYVEDWGKFIGIGTGDRMSAASWLGLYESNDGIHFTLVDVARENTYTHLHNAGISSRSNGHINLEADAKKLRVIYAYGEGWGCWNTRIQPITLSLTDGNNIAAAKKKPNLPDPKNRVDRIPDSEQYPAYIRASHNVYTVVLGEKEEITPKYYAYNSYFAEYEVTKPASEMTFKSSDTKVVKATGGVFKIVGEGTATVTLKHRNATATVTVNVLPKATKTEDRLVAAKEEVTLCLGEKNKTTFYLRVRKYTADGKVEEYYVGDSSAQVRYTDYNKAVIQINAKGGVTPLKEGETDVTVKLGRLECHIKVTVSKDASTAYYHPKGA